MKFDLLAQNKPFNLLMKIRALQPVRLIISIFDPESGAQFIERKIMLRGNRKLRFKLPIVSEKIRVSITNKDLPLGDSHYIIDNIKIQRDTKCPLDLTKRDKRFIKLAKWFALELNSLHSGEKGTIYQSEEFTIILVDRIIEEGKEVSTPARIGQDSGIIQVSKTKVQDFTVPMLMVMLLHEYAHHFKNPEYGKEVSNELSADLIALNIALNLGFDSFEVKHCFKEVFQDKKTKLNKRRWNAIQEFISRFKQTEKKRCNTRRPRH